MPRLRRGRVLHWMLLGFALGLALWAKYFVVVLAAPLALFLLFDRDARKALATPGPWIALAVALLVMAPHLLWLVRNDFLPFAYASARAAPSRGLLDHVLHPVIFAAGQLGFLLPALLIAAALAWPRPKADEAAAGVAAKADAFDRRIVTLLAFGPAAITIALSALTGRGAIAMWGYPLWLFLGVWIVLFAPCGDHARATRARGDVMGRGIRVVCARLRRQLFGAGDARPSLSRGVLSGRSAGGRTRAALSCRHRPAARLRDRRTCGTAAMSPITRASSRGC